MRIQHNIAALNSHRQLGSNNSAVGKNLEKLSSGFKINRAGDDAAGLAISEKMRAQITSLNTASKNSQDGISLVQTAEGALTEVHSMLNRMTELAGQAANGTYQDAVDRENAMKELDSLRSEIDRISDSTNYNGIKLLDGSMGGGQAGDTQTVAAAGNLGAFSYTVTGAPEGTEVELTTGAAADGVTASFSNGKLTISLGATQGSKITQDDIDTAIRNASGISESAKGIKVKLDNSITATGNTSAGTSLSKATVAKAVYASAKSGNVTNTAGATTNIKVTASKAGAITNTLTFSNAGTLGATVDAGNDATVVLDDTKNYTASEINQMLGKAGAGMTVSFEGAIKGSDLTGTAALTLGSDVAGSGAQSSGGLSLQIGESSEAFNQLTVDVASMSTVSLGIDGIDIGTQDGAKAAVDVIKKAINKVSSTRGDLGAIQNRLEHTINNLGVTAENMTAAESRIRDVDMAQEMMNFTKNNILTQASQAMLAQANQLPQGVLQLLQ